jgi:hypothetical protein
MSRLIDLIRAERQARAGGPDYPRVIIRAFVKPGDHGEPLRAVARFVGADIRLEKTPDESLAMFRARADAAAEIHARARQRGMQ